MSGHDEYLLRKAREELAAGVDLSDDREMARKIGRLEVALEQLLEMVDRAAGGPETARRAGESDSVPRLPNGRQTAR